MLVFGFLFGRPGLPFSIALGQVLIFGVIIALIRATISALNVKSGTTDAAPLHLAAIDSLYASIICIPALIWIALAEALYGPPTGSEASIFTSTLHMLTLTAMIALSCIFIFELSYIYLKSCLRFSWIKYLLPPFLFFWDYATFSFWDVSLLIRSTKSGTLLLGYILQFGNPLNAVLALYKWAMFGVDSPFGWQRYPLSELMSVLAWILLLLLISERIFVRSQEGSSGVSGQSG